MTVQEAIKMGWANAEHLVHVWDYARSQVWDVATKRKWIQDWASLTRVKVPEQVLTDQGLLPRTVRR